MASPRSRLLVLLLVAAATVGVYVVAFVLDTTDDRPDQLDVAPVPAAAAQACLRLHADLDGQEPLPPDADLAARQARVAEQGQRVQAMVAEVRRVGEKALRADQPAEEWLADWTTLTDARTRWAQAGATGPVPAPVVDGRVVTDRMNAIGVDDCSVPTALTSAP